MTTVDVNDGNARRCPLSCCHIPLSIRPNISYRRLLAPLLTGPIHEEECNLSRAQSRFHPLRPATPPFVGVTTRNSQIVRERRMPTLLPHTQQSNHFTSTDAFSEISFGNMPMLKSAESLSLAQGRFTRHTLSRSSIPVSSLYVSHAGSCLASRLNLKSQQCNTFATKRPYPFQTCIITIPIRITD